MPRKDVPLPGQGKRGRRKAWRDNADQAIAIYSLTAEEMPEIIATEEVMSQALPYWDDEAPQPQSQSPRQAYTEEEAQELVEKAYQDGWQQGMEEGYKLGKDKGYKECTSVKSQPLFKTLFVSFHRFLFSDAFMVTYDYLFKHFYIF